ncbi:MAG: hypothetical protein R2744_12665 [Bacteroidales bacterium]
MQILPRWIIRVVNMVMPSLALGMIDLSQYHKLWSSITGIPLDRKEFLASGQGPTCWRDEYKGRDFCQRRQATRKIYLRIEKIRP